MSFCFSTKHLMSEFYDHFRFTLSLSLFTLSQTHLLTHITLFLVPTQVFVLHCGDLTEMG